MNDSGQKRGGLPPLNWLRAFEAAARCGSFAAAGQELGVTAAAVSQQVRLLEAQLGVPLFRRTSRGLAASDLGAAYLPTVADALDRLRAGTGEVFGGARRLGPRAGPLVLRAPGSFALLWLMPRLDRFRRLHPDIALSVTTRAEPAEFAVDGIDVELRYGAGDWPGLKSARLGAELAFPVAARRMTRRDLADATLLHVIGYREGWPAWCRAAGLGGIDTEQGLRFDVSHLALDAARRGIGVALGRWPMVAEDLRRGTLVAPLRPALPVAEAYHVVWSQRSARQDRIAAFRDFVLAEAKAQKPPAWSRRG
ncbi:MAG: LysR family transcriptional regulator [Alphaproteobacteria bacterium]|nr:LysR family transcriptional regulator [Alphaproteobacteria bacterium]